MNFSHGDHEEHAQRIKTIRQVSEELGIHIGILQDLQGPKIRLGRFKNGPVNVKNGDKRILLINGLPVGAVNRVPVNNEIRANLHIGGLAKRTNLTKPKCLSNDAAGRED